MIPGVCGLLVRRFHDSISKERKKQQNLAMYEYNNKRGTRTVSVQRPSREGGGAVPSEG